MKTVLFFDRSRLTSLYILLTKELQGKVNVVHVAFSEKESAMLKNAGISDFIDYHSELTKMVDTIKPSESLVKEIDEIIISQSKGLINLNGSIQSDRGFALLDYDEALLLACCHYTVWKRIFEENHADLMYHEPASMFMTHIAAICCKDQGGEYIFLTRKEGDGNGYYYLNIDGENFCCKEIEEKYHLYRRNPNLIDTERCKKYVEEYRIRYNSSITDLLNIGIPKWRLRYISFRHCLTGKNRQYDRLKDNIDYWLNNNNPAAEKLYNLRQYKNRRIKFSLPVEGERYFYYSMHLEPEAVVLYLSGGLYTNQIKLIENIAASLPPGYYLYVKDHPSEYAYRKADDYERLQKVPNVRLIDQRVSGKKLMLGAVGVISINGTAGVEALMLGKKAFCFGRCYYSICDHVKYIHNIRDSRGVFYNSIQHDLEEDQDYYAFIYAYLTSLHKGFVSFFGDKPEKSGVDLSENARIIASSIIEYLD